MDAELPPFESDLAELHALLALDPTDGLAKARAMAEGWAAEAAVEIGMRRGDDLYTLLESISDPATRRDLLRAAFVGSERALRFALVVLAFAVLPMGEVETASDLFTVAGGGEL